MGAGQESVALRGRGAGHHQHGIGCQGKVRFIEKWDISHKEECFRGSQGLPLALNTGFPHEGVQNAFQSLPGLGVLKYVLA
jgi:hypothetical protein